MGGVPGGDVGRHRHSRILETGLTTLFDVLRVNLDKGGLLSLHGALKVLEEGRVQES